MISILKKSIKNSEIKKLKKVESGCWVHIEEPTEKEQKFAVSELGLEEGLVTDALDPFEVPRIELENNDIYIYTRIPHERGNGVVTTPLLIVYRNDTIVTISRKHLLFFDKMSSDSYELMTTQKTKLVLQIFDEINTTYNNFLMKISKTVRSTSVDIENIDNKDIIRLLKYESTLNDFMGALAPMNVILENILSGKFLQVFEQDKDLVEDLSLANTQLIELAKATLKNMVNIREVYSTIMTNNLNRVIKLLTALTIILTIPTIVSSLYGMNVKLPLADNPWAFWEILGGTAAISLLTLYIFIRKKWF
jgi:magnesium transporter